MSTLTRNSIRSGAYLDSFHTLPDDMRWSAHRIEHSLAETMQTRPHGGDIWLFAYGSLIWNPLLDFADRRKATLAGWHRSFCLRMIAGRGKPATPGRMLAVEPGGATRGIVYRLPEAAHWEELRLVWTREMVAGSYRPTWLPLTLDDGRTVTAIAFVADPSRPQYEPDATIPTVAPLIAAASGAYGSNADYVFMLAAALAKDDLADGYVSALNIALRQLPPPY